MEKYWYLLDNNYLRTEVNFFNATIFTSICKINKK